MNQLIVVIGILVVLGTISVGLYLMKQEHYANKWLQYALRINIALAVLVLVIFSASMASTVAFAAGEAGEVTPVNGLGLLAMALSTGLAAIGAGYAVGAVGSSAIGAVSEDPKILGKTLIFVGLAEGIAIYGLVISIIILGKL